MIYAGMSIEEILVTPQLAQRWLIDHNVGNRRIRDRVVEQYADDMRHGRWQPKPSAISFRVDGRLGNGQHTLSAIVLSNRAQSLLVARNVSDAAIAVVDVGIRRSMGDIATFLGVEPLATGRVCAVVRAVIFGHSDTRPRSFAELYDGYLTHQTAIDTVIAMGGAIPAIPRAVMVRAYYTADVVMIQRFSNVLVTGVMLDENDVAAVRLRDFLRSLRGAQSHKVRAELHAKSQAALVAFFARKPLTKLYGIAQKMFPLPGEQS